MPDGNGRTHEPALREVVSQLDDLKELMASKFEGMERWMAERDRRYDAQFKGGETAIATALSAQKELTGAVLAQTKASQQWVGTAVGIFGVLLGLVGGVAALVMFITGRH